MNYISNFYNELSYSNGYIVAKGNANTYSLSHQTPISGCPGSRRVEKHIHFILQEKPNQVRIKTMVMFVSRTTEFLILVKSSTFLGG